MVRSQSAGSMSSTAAVGPEIPALLTRIFEPFVMPRQVREHGVHLLHVGNVRAACGDFRVGGQAVGNRRFVDVADMHRDAGAAPGVRQSRARFRMLPPLPVLPVRQS